MLYNKKLEKDNCGYGLICNKNGIPSRKIVEKSIDALSSMAHRGGVGFDGKTGDGSGLLFDINNDFKFKPHAFMKYASEAPISLDLNANSCK